MNRRRAWIALWAGLFALRTVWDFWRPAASHAQPLTPGAVLVRLALLVGMLALMGAAWSRAGAPEVDRPRASWLVRALAAAVALLAGAKVLAQLPDLVAVARMTDRDDLGAVVTLAQIAALVLWHATSLVAGVQLGRRRPWARQWVLVSCALGLAVTVLTQTVAPDGERLWDRVARELRHEPWMVAWTLAPDVVAVLALVLLTRPQIAAEFPAASLAARRWPIGAAAAFELLLWGPRWMALPPPRPKTSEAELVATPVEPGTGQLTVRLLYDERPLEGLGDRPLRLWLNDLKTRRSSRFEGHADGSVVIRDVPTGVYRVSVVVDADARNGLGTHEMGLPGDLRADSEPVVLRVGGDAPTVDVKLGRLIRLVEPEDTIDGLPRAGGGSPPRLSSPVHFAWEPVAGADHYTVSVEVERGGRVVPEVSSLVREPRWTVKLPVSQGDQAYRFSMSAWGAHGQIGGFEIQGFGWYGWDYRFTVGEAYDGEPPTAETWMMLPPLRGPEPDFSAPIDQWCDVTDHPTEAACRAALATLRAQHAHSVWGYSYYGALCMSVRDVHRPSRRERLRTRVEATMRRAVGDRAEMGDARSLGFVLDPAPAFVVVARANGSAARRPLLAIDISDADGALRYAMAADWAAAGFPAVLVVGNSPDLRWSFADLFVRWNPESASWTERRGGGRNAGTMLAVLPDVTVAVDDLLPPPCP